MHWNDTPVPGIKKLNKYHIVGEILNVQVPEYPLQVKGDSTPGPVYDVTCILPPSQHGAVMCEDRQAYVLCALTAGASILDQLA